MHKVHFPDCLTALPTDGGLYPYQRVARDLLWSGEQLNLLVASPTGSGKTRVIEEAIAVARADGSRIYVAEPLIALVEQIYSRVRGDDVCMLTGPSKKGVEAADVTICTFEVLASKAGAQPECLDGCPRIVIDEFHYLASDRGTVLQEILAQCRSGRSIVALSGTMPNVAELAALLSRINGFPTYVLGAHRRPIDISFFCYSSESQLRRPVRPAKKPPILRAQAIGGLHDRQSVLAFLRRLVEWDCNPSLLVTFSCRKLDEMADWAASITSIDRSQRALVERGFTKLLRSVPTEDHCLFTLYRSWARCGVAVHHSHAPTPYLELVSWLAEQRALSFIFSSSTLAAGINLPVRTMCLLSARIPQKQPDGGVAHRDIDPMLFHQLVGRAGRPGLETVGNCVIVARRDDDYPSAQALMMSTIPAVRPRGAFEAGDVLRAARGHRDLPGELQAVAEPSQHELSLSLSLSDDLKRSAFARLGLTEEQRDALQAQASCVVELRKHPAALLPFGVVAPAAPAFLHLRRDGSFHVTEASAKASEDELVVTLTASKRAKAKIPLEEIQRSFDVRALFQRIREAEKPLAPLGDDARRVLTRICLSHAEAEAMLEASPLRDHFRASLRALEAAGFVQCDRYGCAITRLGLAACEIRTLPDPSTLLAALLKMEPLEATSCLALASQALQDGTSREDGEALVAKLIEEGGAFAELLSSSRVALADLLSRGLIPVEQRSDALQSLATLAWSGGARLEQLQSLVPIGSFCRHVTRVHDLCAELSNALTVLDVDHGGFEEANALILRGLPFLRRGCWKLLEDDEA